MIILAGIGLGLLARVVIGPPESELNRNNRFLTPLPDNQSRTEFNPADPFSEEIDLPIIGDD